MPEIDMLPSYIDNTSFKYIMVDDKYIASLVISNFPKETEFLQVIESIPKNYSYDMNIYVNKQDTLRTLKELTYQISSSGSELKTSSANQIDVDVISESKTESQKLRYDIQINNEEVYKITILITFYSKSKSELLLILKSFQSKLYSKNLISNIINFRHMDGYLLSIPMCEIKNSFILKNSSIFTTSALSNVFPFYTKTIFDKSGILFGFTLEENRICCMDIFNKNNLNSNMCIFGSSGSGKSYFTKLMIIRHFLIGKIQYIFDPESEYINIIKELNGYILSFNNDTKYSYNILDIDEYDIYFNKENFLSIKISNIIILFSKLIPGITINEKKLLENVLTNLYKEYEITDDIKSMYITQKENKIFLEKKLKDSSYFPTLNDLKNKIKDTVLLKKLEKSIFKRYSLLMNKTNIEFTKNIVLFDVSGNQDNINILIEFFLNKIENILKYNKEKEFENANTIIYMDEIWKFIAKDNNIASIIYDKFKTIRKLNAGLVAITQDINDFFMIQNGNYGKGILNNCNFKMFFKLDYEDSEILTKLSVLNKEVLDKIKVLNKGKVLMTFNKDYTILKVEANNYEKSIIQGGNN